MPEPLPIYSSRILKLYVECLNTSYPDIDTDAILRHAHVSKHELEDTGHWFDQQQVDRFYEKILEVTGNPEIARQAGRFVVFKNTAGPVKQHALGLLKVSSIYLLLAKLYPMFSRGAQVKARRLASNKVEIDIVPLAGVQESPHQCLNRIGIFESLATLYTDKFAAIDHCECIHEGGKRCRYIVTWEKPAHRRWKRNFLIASVMAAPVAVVTFFLWPFFIWGIALPAGGMVLMGMLLRAYALEKQELARTVQNQGNVAEDHIKEIDYRYQGALLVQKIGHATSTILDVNQLANIVVLNIQQYFDFDRGLIMLADQDRQRLVYAAGYGFDDSMDALLSKTQFRIDNPEAKGIFIQVFHEQRPIRVDDIETLRESLSVKSQQFAHQIGSKSLICLPIVYEDQSLGVLAVDNIITKRPLTKSDMNLLMGVAYQTALSIFSANARKKLHDSEERFRSLYENAPTAYVSIRVEDAVIVNCNAAAKRLLGFARHHLIGSSLLDHVAKDKGNQMRAKWIHQLLQNGQSVHAEVLELLHHDKQPIWVNVSLEPFIGRHGQVVEGRCILVDTTEQRRLEEQLRNAQRMEAIGTLAGGVAHDLSNILSAIVGYPDLLLMDIPHDSPLHKPLKKIKSAGHRAAVIVQDLLTLARRGVAITEVINVNDIVNDYLQAPESEDLIVHHPHIKVEADLDQDLVPVKGSAVHLVKALMNIVNNAAEAMTESGVIHISTRNQYVNDNDSQIKAESGEYAVLVVKDSGHGIKSEDLKRVFEPFFTKKVMGRSGTGLGMAIVWAAVQDHNGFIDVDSQEGYGTTVRIYLPKTHEKQSFHQVMPFVSELPGRGEKILVVDDDIEHREIAVHMLTRLGYKVETAESGEAALAQLEKYQPDIIILDMVLGSSLDGLSTYRKALERYPNQKAIITSVFTESNRVKKALGLGVGAYIKKPYNLNEISVAVRHELDQD